MRVRSFAVGLIIEPVAFISISIRMVQLALPTRFSIFPLTVIVAAIEPFLIALPITQAVQPLSFIDGATIEGNWLTPLPNIFRKFRRL